MDDCENNVGETTLAKWPDPEPPTQLDRIEAMLTELLEGKRQIERFAEEIQGKGMLGMMSALKGFSG